MEITVTNNFRFVQIIFSVRSSQTLKEGKTFNPTSVELLVSSHQPKNHSMEMHVITQSLWNLGISCKLFDGHDNTLQSLKNFCKINRIPYLLIIDSQHMLIKVFLHWRISIQVLNLFFIGRLILVTRMVYYTKRETLQSSLNFSKGGGVTCFI